MKISWRKWSLASFAVGLLALAVWAAVAVKSGTGPTGAAGGALLEPPTPVHTVAEFEIRKSSTVSESLREAGLAPEEIHDIVVAAAKVRSLRSVPVGLKFSIHRELGPLERLAEVRFLLTPREYLSIVWTGGTRWVASQETRP